jgi:hypothetical protein
MQPEDKALLIGAAAAGLAGVGSFLTGNLEYAAIGGIVLSIAAALKAAIPPRTP